MQFDILQEKVLSYLCQKIVSLGDILIVPKLQTGAIENTHVHRFWNAAGHFFFLQNNVGQLDAWNRTIKGYARVD